MDDGLLKPAPYRRLRKSENLVAHYMGKGLEQEHELLNQPA